MLLLAPRFMESYMSIHSDGEHAVDREFIAAFSGIIDRSTRDIIRH